MTISDAEIIAAIARAIECGLRGAGVPDAEASANEAVDTVLIAGASVYRALTAVGVTSDQAIKTLDGITADVRANPTTTSESKEHE